jgi:hypothetical protein
MTIAAEADAAVRVRDEMGERLAWAQIAMGSLVTAYGQLAESVNPATIGLSLFYLILQWGMSYRAWQARLLFRRGQWVTGVLNIGAMAVAAWFVHAALLQALYIADEKGLLHGVDAELLAGAMVLLPFLEPLGFWSHALLGEDRPAKQCTTGQRGWRPRLVGAGALSALAAGSAHAETSVQEGARPPPRGPHSVVQMADKGTVQRDKVARARALHSEGVNNTEIGRRLGVHRNTVGNWLKAA